jgi:hypothetical protein
MKNIFLVQTDKPSRLIKNNHSQLLLTIQTLPLDRELGCFPQHIYITSSEEIKEGDYIIDNYAKINLVQKVRKCDFDSSHCKNGNWKKIILTTDPDLIADGVQAIDDEFLEWVVKNPSCEDVKWNAYPINPNGNVVATNRTYPFDGLISNFRIEYKIIIPKEEPKQYTSQELEGFEDFKKMIKPKQDEIDFMSKELDIERKRFSKQKTLEEAAKNFANNSAVTNYEEGINVGKYQGFIAGAKEQAKKMYSEQDMQEYATFCIRCYEQGLPCIVPQDWFKLYKNK